MGLCYFEVPTISPGSPAEVYVPGLGKAHNLDWPLSKGKLASELQLLASWAQKGPQPRAPRSDYESVWVSATSPSQSPRKAWTCIGSLGSLRCQGQSQSQLRTFFFNKMFLDQSVNNQLLPPSHAATSHKVCSLALSCCVTFGK